MTVESLYREEALEHFTIAASLNRHSVVPTLGMTASSIVIASITLAAVLFAVFTQFARKETVAGVIEPKDGAIRIESPPLTGRITTLHVADGAGVERGQILITLVSGLYGEDGARVSDDVGRELGAQIASIRRQLRSVERDAQQQQARIRDRIGGMQREKAELLTLVDLGKARVVDATSRYRAMDALRHKGHLSQAAFEDAHLRYTGVLQEQASLRRQLAALKSTLEDSGHELAALPTARDARVAELEARIAAVEARRVEAGAAGRTVVRAPVAGRFIVNGYRVGDTVAPGTVLGSIVTDAREMICKLFVPSRAIGFVKQGQPIRVMHDAFPYQRFGPQAATITAVSEDAFLPAGVPAQRVANPSTYLVTAALDNPYHAATGALLTLRSGMSVHADIVLERRTILEWFLEPVLSWNERR